MNAFAHNAFAASGGISQTAADARYARLASANTFSAAQTFSVNGAASTPALSLTGTILTGQTSTTNKPHLLIEPAGTTSNNWSTAGTLFGGNAPSGFTGNLLDLQVNGGAICSVSYQGTITVPNGQGLTSVSGSLAIGPNQFSGGAYLTFTGAIPTSARYTYYDSHAYLSGGYSIRFANNRNDAPDSGFVWGASGTVRVTNGSTGRGTLDAAGYQVGGVAGAAGGTFTTITSITVSNGIITAISGS